MEVARPVHTSQPNQMPSNAIVRRGTTFVPTASWIRINTLGLSHHDCFGWHRTGGPTVTPSVLCVYSCPMFCFQALASFPHHLHLCR